MADYNQLASDDGNQLAAPSGPYASYGNPYAPGWYQSNIVPVVSPSGARFMVNKAAAQSFTGFLTDLEKAGYRIDPGVSGGYNLRNITGGSTLSPHAYGLAIDINPPANPYSKTSTGGSLKTDLPPNVGEMAAAHGLQWGGNWTSLKDPMHFEFGGTSAPTMEAARKTPSVAAATAPQPAAPVVPPAQVAAATPPINPLSSLNAAAMTPMQRLAMYQQLAQLFAPPQRQQATAAGSQVGGVDASIPMRVV